MTAYQDKVYGCWLGKCLGGAIGMAYEGVPFQPELTEQDIALQDVPNDDLELQLVWLMALKKHGPGLDHRKLGQIWLDHIPHGVDEYSFALRNLKRGIMPPASGWKDNFFIDGMGAAIRSEIWAAVFAGRPDAAGHFAALDASVDHWGDGVRAEVYMATAECLAFENPDCAATLKQALDILPDCRLKQTLCKVHELHESGMSDAAMRDYLLRHYQHHNFTDCVMNLASMTFALLRGHGDFLKTVLLAVNMGRDTDCTAASAGAYLGIAAGSEIIPEQFRGKVRNDLTLSDFVRVIPDVPQTLSDTVAATIELHDTLILPEQKYPAYKPYVPTGSEPSMDSSRWLAVLESDCDIAALEKTLAETGKVPAELQSRIVSFDGLTMDLEPYAEPGGNLHLFSFLNVKHPGLDGDDVYLSATADTGLTLWLNGRKEFDQFSRALMIPSFHRAEGGMSYRCPMQDGDHCLVHLRLYSCTRPLRCTFMFGNGMRDHLDGFHLSI